MKDIVTKHIIDEKLKFNRKRQDYFYASDGYIPGNKKSTRCARQLGYQFLGYDEEPRTESYPVFVIGDLIHDYIQKLFVKEKFATMIEDFSIKYDDDGKAHYIRKNSNKVIIDDPPMHGRIDIKFRINEHKYIADIKSVGDKAWYFLKSQPKEPHYAQMQSYLFKTKDEGISEGFLLYINKSTGDMKEFHIVYDESYTKKMFLEYRELYKQIKSDGLPNRCFKSGYDAPWQCYYCGFTKICLGLTREKLEKQSIVNYDA